MNIEITVPNGISGDWKVETFTVSDKDSKIARLQSIFHQGRGYIPAGTYKKLTRNGTLVISNAPDEIEDFMMFVYKAEGNVLVNGMGLGLLLQALLNKSEVEKITVIEISKDVIKLVAPTYLKDKRVTIINADAFDWKPINGEKYDYVWHDIWDNICSDNLEQMKKLHRKYGRMCHYQKSWGRTLCEQQRY